jgi:hypothetical protein
LDDGYLGIAEPSPAAPADQFLRLEPPLTSLPKAESPAPAAPSAIQPAPPLPAAAHDTVLEAAALAPSQPREMLLAKLAWQCRCEQLSHRDRADDEERWDEQAVDLLLTFNPP